MSLEGLELARRCHAFADSKKASEPVLLDLRALGGASDFFLIVSGDSEPHLKAIAGEVERGVREECGRRPFRVSGNSASQWVILDYGDVLVHVMHTQKRRFYRLEDLWGDAARLEVG
ncbi:MAG: ribosome silencing factor [Verrucomicrobia bacterium]|nr:ribosome silencing factor [Verrucomicrobiota bacterium]NBR63157.1 ribosome silencing factor [Verrucomicrobiota bacterium]